MPIKCQVCLLLFYTEEAAQSRLKDRKKMATYYEKLVRSTRERIAEKRDLRTLHLCNNEIHHKLALEIRTSERGITNETVSKKREAYKEARRNYNTAVLKYAEEAIRNPNSKESFRLEALVKRYKILKGQRLRRLEEAIGKLR